jgi:hypothetical protein
VTALPPVDAGAENTTDNVRCPGVTDEIAGAPGVVNGVPDTAVAAVPEPTAFTARTETWYVVPLVRPVMESGLVDDDGVRAVHVVPLSVEYS